MAAKASHIDVIDTVFPDVNDEEGLRRETEYAKRIGFTGKAVINPRQIEIIHDVYTPTDEEVRKAYRIVKEFKINSAAGIGCFCHRRKDDRCANRYPLPRYILETGKCDGGIDCVASLRSKNVTIQKKQNNAK